MSDQTLSDQANTAAENTAKKKPKGSESQLSLIARRIVYRVLRLIARMLCVLWFRIRVDGRHHVPSQGGGMLLSTHQSGLDPILVGLACNRNLNFLARSTLFRNPAFSLLLKTLDSIEIDRERGGLSGLREMLSRLRSGKVVLLFPEGTRTQDGAIGVVKPGFFPIAKRSDVPLIPVAIVGAFECMPKGSKWIFPKPIAVVFGKPIPPEDYRNWSEEQAVRAVATSLGDLYQRGKNSIEGTY
ncbi:MAG: lysophospholipid acyltransferase family protein [Planctomycetota bacterium]|nr:lysophospholipid acyltransferase family protein [Planctomycetota bacterium]